MPDETSSIDYAMEAASGPHFSGLRLDGGRLSSSPKSSLSINSILTKDSLLNQPFVIGFSLSLSLLNLNIFNQKLIICYGDGAGVSGGTASGKTTVCDMIIQQLHDHRVVLVNQVHYTTFEFNFSYTLSVQVILHMYPMLYFYKLPV